MAKVAPKVAPVSAKKAGTGGNDEEVAELINEVRGQTVASVRTTARRGVLIRCLYLRPQMEMLKSTIQDMEKERDFYFGKLRNIELICQEKEGEGDPTLQRIVDILYATDVSD